MYISLYYTNKFHIYDILYNEISACPIAKGKSETYIQVNAGFDIETTNTQKLAFMYIWQLGIGSHIIKGRTWEQLIETFDSINTIVENIDKKAKVIIWDANLPYEFQFMRKRFTWNKIFAKKNRQILTAQYQHIILHECLSISGQGGLKNLAKNYCTTQKAVGDLDYNIMRNSTTILTDEENGYVDNDVAILIEWADYIWKNVFSVYNKIPLTITQTIRWDMKNAIGEQKALKSVYHAMQNEFPENETEYKRIMRWLFRGGYTHSNIIYTNCELQNVTGIDFTSSYPAAMCHGYYPISKFIKINDISKQDIPKLLKTKCCIMTVRFWGIKSTATHSIESSSKCISMVNPIIDNGRIHAADFIEVMLTELDYASYKKFYKWDKMEIIELQIAKRGSLPDYLIETMLENYVKKCKLKVEGKSDTIEYVNAKVKTNSFYGCCVTQLQFEDYDIDENGDWITKAGKTYDELKKYQILSPYWGIYITSHARYNLFTMLYILRDYAVYCDTDSIYYLQSAPKEITQNIDKWNTYIDNLNKKMFPEHYNYLHDLGAFDEIGVYSKFKTLGAKRYIKYGHDKGKKEDSLHVTIAGLPKDDMKTYMEKMGVSNAFDVFNNNMEIPSSICSKLLRTYNDNYTEMAITDSAGTTEIMSELSSVALSPNKFKLTMATVYLHMIETYAATFREDLKHGLAKNT